MSVDIRTLDASDEASKAQLDALKKEVWPKADEEHFGADLHPHFFHTAEATLVYEENGQLLGYLEVRCELGVAYMGSTGIVEQARRRGVATKLVEAAENWARENYCHKVTAETGTEWTSKGLVTAMGYTPVVTFKRHFGKIDFIVFEKFLD
ncbi:MAG TPA: GNAT family N-acetyltransferase [Verrucomicrobiae bacterium]|nr:GNAT family N-acetyltransferase [Verrucomicrobiae bacterium]